MSRDSLYIVCTEKSVNHLLNIDHNIIFFFLLYALQKCYAIKCHTLIEKLHF